MCGKCGLSGHWADECPNAAKVSEPPSPSGGLVCDVVQQQLIRERLGKMIDTVHEKPLVTVKEADVMHKLDLKRWQKKHWHDVSRLAAQAREYDARIHALC